MYQFKLEDIENFDLWIEFQYISCISSRKLRGAYKKATKEFQYISCISSSLEKRVKNKPKTNFNTSHVSVQGICSFLLSSTLA